MKRTSAVFQLSLAVASLLVMMILIADWLRLIPDVRRPVLEGRGHLCESFAFSVSALAEHDHEEAIEGALRAIAARNSDILSIGVRRADGSLLAEIGPHAEFWNNSSVEKSGNTLVRVPVTRAQQSWGTIEVSFRPIPGTGWDGTITNPLWYLILFVGSGSTIATYLFLRRALHQLNPSKVVPNRVRTAFDSLTDGLIVLDSRERVALINKSLSDTLGCDPNAVIGNPVSALPLIVESGSDGTVDPKEPEVMPWSKSLQTRSSHFGTMLNVKSHQGRQLSFIVNCAPVTDDRGSMQGVVASFGDVTPLEEKRAELADALMNLQRAAAQIRKQNRELEHLATRDSLTGCLNRRAFFEQATRHWEGATRSNMVISCLMVDIDKFKSVNDTYGHSAGDDVIRAVGKVLQDAARDDDLACRYGGEEFCLLLVNKGLDQATAIAEEIRKKLAAIEFPKFRVTASLGVSCSSLKAHSIQEMLDQADKALYFSKRTGRDRVTRWDAIMDNPAVAEKPADSVAAKSEKQSAVQESQIPYPAVSALISALGFRHGDTAEHCRRVADLCVILGEGLMSMQALYTLEIGALLHDIGKIGVPDDVLLKPGSLTEAEWEIMERHDRIGVEIVAAAFSSPELSTIVENHHAFFGGGARDPALPTGLDIPLGARILAIADAFDAMVSDRVYRKGRSAELAFNELRACAGQQFDPDLVERFISRMRGRDLSKQSTNTQATKAIALNIGLQLERLAVALDNRDLDGLVVLAGRLQDTATLAGLPEISSKALELEQALSRDIDLLAVLRCANELMRYCRKTQNAFLQDMHFDQATAGD